MNITTDNTSNTFKFTKYVVVGLSAVAVDFCIFIFLLSIVGAPLAVANTIGIVVGFLWGFALNKIWAFQSFASPLPQLFFTFLLLVFNIGVTTALIAVLVNQFGLAVEYAKIIMQATVVLWNFIIFNRFIFKK